MDQTDVKPARSTTRRVALQSAVLAFCHAGSALAVLAVTPLILARLGLQDYGVWALVATFVRYSSAGDLGFAPAVIKYVATYAARSELHKARQVVTFATLAYVVVAALVAFPIHILALPAAHLLHVPAALDDQVPLLAVSLSVTLFAMLLAGGLSSALTGLGRLNVSSPINGGGNLFFAVTAAIGMLLGQGLPFLCLALSAQYSLVAVANLIALSRCMGGLPFVAPWSLEKSIVTPMFTFGGWIQVSSIMVLINAETDVVIIAAIAGVSAAALFDLGNRLARLIRVVSFYANTAVMPALSRLEVEAGTAHVFSLLTTATRGMAFVTVIAFGALAGMAPNVLHLWLGPAAPTSSLVPVIILLLGVAYSADNIASVASTFLRALGRPKLETLYQVMSAVINIALTLALAWRFGVAGILFGTMCGALVSATIYLQMLGKQIGKGTSRIDFHWLAPLVFITAIAAAAAYLAGHALPESTQRINAIVALVVQAAIYGVVIVVGFRLARLLTPSDRERLRTLVPPALAVRLKRMRKLTV